MVKRVRRARSQPLHVEEWRVAKGFSIERLAEHLRVSRETIWRWETEQHRLNPPKMAALAKAIGIEPGQFYHRPDRPSVDAILADQSDDVAQTAADIVRRLTKAS